MKNFTMMIIIFSSLLFIGPKTWAEEVTVRIHTPWVRAAPPTVKILAAYMIIENTSAQEKILTSVTSPLFEKVEIHQTTLHEGIMHMQAQAQLVIAPQSKLVLEPGGYHLMLIDRKQALKTGDPVQLNLKFSSGEELTIIPSVQDVSHPTHMK